MKTVLRASLLALTAAMVAGCHGAFEDLGHPTMLAIHILVLRGAMSMSQAAHSSAFGVAAVHATGQQS